MDTTSKEIESLRECYFRDDPYVGKGGVNVTGGVPSEISVGIDRGHYESQEDVAAVVAGSLWRDHTKVVRMLLDHIAGLEAVVDKLPKCWRLDDTGELVQDWPVILGENLFAWKLSSVVVGCGFVSMRHEGEEWFGVVRDGDGAQWPARPEETYATHAAAEAAQKKVGE